MRDVAGHTENGDAATSNDEKTFEFIFFPHFAGVNYVHLYVCTLNFRRNKICQHPRVAFLYFLNPICAIATEMQSTKNSNCCSVSSYSEVIEITVCAMRCAQFLILSYVLEFHCVAWISRHQNIVFILYDESETIRKSRQLCKTELSSWKVTEMCATNWRSWKWVVINELNAENKSKFTA